MTYSRRTFLQATGGFLLTSWSDYAAKPKFNESPTLDFSRLLKPVQARSVLKSAEWFIWCSTMVRTRDGTCHLFFSRWPKKEGFNAWVTHSEVAYATAKDPLGPYVFQKVALPARGKEFWDGDVTHNPTVLQFGRKYYLYYMGNFGDGSFWNHRNHQRIGVAVADHPAGPWQRFKQPLIDVTPNAWDHLMTSNPSVLQRPDGKYQLVYKGVADGKLPFGGKVRHGIALADQPGGPFRKHDKTIFDFPGSGFPAEDPFVWHQEGRYYAIVKDMRNFTQAAGTLAGQATLALFESVDGLDWKVAQHPLVSRLELHWSDGSVTQVSKLERPQLYRENDQPKVLFAAVMDKNSETTYNVAIPLST